MTSTTGAVGRAPVIRVAGGLGGGRRSQLLEVAREGTVPTVGTGPTGIDALEPLVTATVDGETAFLPDPSEAVVRETVTAVEDGSLPEDATFRVTHSAGRPTLPVPDDGPLSVGRRQALGPCGWVDPTEPDDIELVSGAADPAPVGAELRGRGRGDAVADEPVVEAWDRAAAGEDPLVVVNGHETDDRPRGDRTLLAGAPLAVLDGAAAVAQHVGATDVIVYLNEHDQQLQQRVSEAVENAPTDIDATVQVAVGPDEYRAGAPTAALEAMEEADRIEPRLQPPPPSEHGLYGRPTVVHTPRTVAQVRAALTAPDAFDTATDDPGTRLVTVTGDVATPATVELPTDRSLSRVHDAVELEGQFKMACVGGPLGGLTRDLSLPCGAPSLRGASLGTDGVVELLTERRCAVAVAGDRVRFASETNSGRCVPGREGTVQLTELLRDVYDGSLEVGKIQELGRVMERTANCQIGEHAPRPVLTAIEEFGSEFRAHADGHCPSGTCTETP